MKNAAFVVRKLEPLDAALYRALRLEALQQAPSAFGSTFETESDYAIAWFEERLAKTVVFGAFQNAALCGIVGFFIQQGIKVQHKGVLWGLYVRPETRGSGVSTALVNAVLTHAKNCVELIQLTVVCDNVQAIRLYERIGFHSYGIEKKALKYQGQYDDEILMTKALI